MRRPRFAPTSLLNPVPLVCRRCFSVRIDLFPCELDHLAEPAVENCFCSPDRQRRHGSLKYAHLSPETKQEAVQVLDQPVPRAAHGRHMEAKTELST